MNEDTRKFVEDPEFDALYRELSSAHRPIKPDIDQERLSALGLMIVRFQRLEHSIRSFIRILSYLPDQKLLDILTVKYSFKNLLSVLSSLAKHRNFAYKTELDKLLKSCSRAEEVRNQLLHSIWTSGPRLKVDLSKHGLQYKFELYSIDDLKRIAAKIDHLDTAIEALMFKGLETVPSHTPATDARPSLDADKD